MDGRRADAAGPTYLLQIGSRTLFATITALKHRLGTETLEELAARTLALNEISFCNLSLAAPIAFDPYESNRHTGAFILIDRVSNATVAAGLIAFDLRRATNIPSATPDGRERRARRAEGWTATMSAMASTRILVSRRPTGSRSAGSARWPS